ncbi:MAG: HD domain-containing protein [Planctomycetota bacterium]|nr:HD domain-containing protein [Planctomycetota bacterium]
MTFLTVRERMASRFRDQVLQSNIDTVLAVSAKLSHLTPGKLKHGSDDWQLAQAVIESLKLPASGFACIIDEAGEIVCHPALQSSPSLRGTKIGHEVFRPASGDEPAPLAELPDEGLVAGEVRFGGIDTHYVATTMIPGTNARLLVHQPVSGLLSASEAAMDGVMLPALAIGGVVLLTTGFVTNRLMRRHDREMQRVNAGLEDKVARRVERALNFRDAMIFGLAKLADYRDSDTGAHLERIAEYCEILARELAADFPFVTDSYIRRLRVASSMHDIGKVGVEDAVLLKAGKLTADERTRIQRHPVVGADTLLAIRERLGNDELVDMAIVVTLEHHERWDGKGYPLGLSGEQIQLPARIVALADVYDALTSKRVYKDAMSHEEAVAIIAAEGGKQFDPRVVAAFQLCHQQFEIARARLQDDRPTVDNTRDPAEAA